jgi:hypothetical protein
MHPLCVTVYAFLNVPVNTNFYNKQINTTVLAIVYCAEASLYVFLCVAVSVQTDSYRRNDNKETGHSHIRYTITRHSTIIVESIMKE